MPPDTRRTGSPDDIAGSKDEAAACEARWLQREDLRVYSEGSELDGGFDGAAVVLFNERTHEWTSLCLHLGPAEKHTVYEAETMCVVPGNLELIRRSRQGGRVASVVLDRKSGIEGTPVRESAIISLIYYTLGLQQPGRNTTTWNSHCDGNPSTKTLLEMSKQMRRRS